MAFWNRRKSDIDPSADYLKSSDAVSRPAAFLLSLVAFFVVFGLVFSLILGGRWAWDKYRSGRDDVAVTQPDKDTDSTVKAPTVSTGTTTPAPAATTPATIVGSGVSTTTPNTVAATTGLPNTGPADTMAIVAMTTIVAGIGHNVYQRKYNR